MTLVCHGSPEPQGQRVLNLFWGWQECAAASDSFVGQ